MDDSFFGFNTKLLIPENGANIKRRNQDGSDEEHYDALNDETFGDDITVDWENTHENLVRLGGLNVSKETKNSYESDLEINLSKVSFDDVEVSCDDGDSENRIQLDPSVWSTTIKPKPRPSVYSNPEAFLREHFSNPFETQPTQLNHTPFNTPKHQNKKNFCTVEDIERNILNEQKKEQNRIFNDQKILYSSPISVTQTQTQLIDTEPQVTSPAAFLNRSPVQPGYVSSPRMNLMPPQMLNAQPRLPHGFSQHLMMGQHNNHLGPQPINFQRVPPPPLTHNLPIALNNFAMHPNFNVVRNINQAMHPQRMASPHPNIIPQNLSNNLNSNQFNQRLVQQIQLNHPMLNNNPRNYNMYNNSNHSNNHNYQKSNSRHNSRIKDNVYEVHDEYANLMSTRDKHWLIGIQLSQINTETPYIDDFYYTAIKGRATKLEGGSNQNQAHKDNQMNHPFTQPKGHAQLILLTMGKNGTNAKNGQNRERKNSENKGDKDGGIGQQKPHTPLQFENSLGKLQYGSVTAPRKIIDMEIMGTENVMLNSSLELSAQRRSRQILLHIETLYGIVLKLEDLNNPMAIAAFTALKEKRLKEIQEQKENMNRMCTNLNNSNRVDDQQVDENENIFELETRDKLLQKLLPGLTIDKIIGMMNVRKGKTLIRRILPHIIDNPIRWDVWTGIFNSLQFILKRDKIDNEGILYALYLEFKKHIDVATINNVIQIANSISFSEKQLNYFFASKFCISSLVAILLRAEQLYSTTVIDENHNHDWSSFLATFSNILSRGVRHQTICISIESDVIEPIAKHLTRFQNINLDSLVGMFSLENDNAKNKT